VSLTSPPRPEEQFPPVEDPAEREALIREARLRARRRRQGYAALAAFSVAAVFAYVGGGGGVPALTGTDTSDPGAVVAGAPNAPDGASQVKAALSGRIVYLRVPTGGSADQGALFTANADGSDEQPLVVPEGTCCPRVSRDGTRMLVFTSSGGEDAFGNAIGTPATMNVDGSGYADIPIEIPGTTFVPRVWSPDGKRIAFEGFDDADPSTHRNGIYTARVSDGGDRTRVSATSRWNHSPAGYPQIHDIPADYSPDGKYIVYYRTVVGSSFGEEFSGQLRITSANGTAGQVRHYVPVRTPGMTPSGWARWSPDGTKILFSDARASSYSHLWTVDADWTNLTRIFGNPKADRTALVDTDPNLTKIFGSRTAGRYAFFPEWSPDGSKIMFSLTTSTDYSTYPSSGIYVVNADGTGLTQVIGGDDYKTVLGWWEE
jgi:Tol biopolymer transport system component